MFERISWAFVEAKWLLELLHIASSRWRFRLPKLSWTATATSASLRVSSWYANLVDEKVGCVKPVEEWLKKRTRNANRQTIFHWVESSSTLEMVQWKYDFCVSSYIYIYNCIGICIGIVIRIGEFELNREWYFKYYMKGTGPTITNECPVWFYWWMVWVKYQ